MLISIMLIKNFLATNGFLPRFNGAIQLNYLICLKISRCFSSKKSLEYLYAFIFYFAVNLLCFIFLAAFLAQLLITKIERFICQLGGDRAKIV